MRLFRSHTMFKCLNPLAFTDILRDNESINSFNRYLLNTNYTPTKAVLDSGHASDQINVLSVMVLPF